VIRSLQISGLKARHLGGASWKFSAFCFLAGASAFAPLCACAQPKQPVMLQSLPDALAPKVSPGPIARAYSGNSRVPQASERDVKAYFESFQRFCVDTRTSTDKVLAEGARRGFKAADPEDTHVGAAALEVALYKSQVGDRLWTEDLMVASNTIKIRSTPVSVHQCVLARLAPDEAELVPVVQKWLSLPPKSDGDITYWRYVLHDGRRISLDGMSPSALERAARRGEVESVWIRQAPRTTVLTFAVSRPDGRQ
jgi:hypothetical protein